MPLVSLWKAPQNRLKQQLMLRHGVRVVDLDDPSMIGRAEYGYIFFAQSNSDAASYAECFRAGIIEFRIEESVYLGLQKIFSPAPGFQYEDVAILYADLPALNAGTLERKLHP